MNKKCGGKGTGRCRLTAMIVHGYIARKLSRGIVPLY